MFKKIYKTIFSEFRKTSVREMYTSEDHVFKKSGNPDLVDAEKQMFNISTNPFSEISNNIVFKD